MLDMIKLFIKIILMISGVIWLSENVLGFIYEHQYPAAICEFSCKGGEIKDAG